jgi:hypothetical protein
LGKKGSGLLDESGEDFISSLGLVSELLGESVDGFG